MQSPRNKISGHASVFTIGWERGLCGLLLLLLSSAARLGRLGGTGPVLAALVVGNGQQAGQGRVAGQVRGRKSWHRRTGRPALDASVLAVAVLVATWLGGNKAVIEGEADGGDWAKLLPVRLVGIGDQFSTCTPW